MKAKTVWKILLDLVMTILYILLVFVPGTGIFFHEVAGIAIGVLFAIHVALNWTALKGLWKSVTAGVAGKKSLFMFILDLLLPIGMPVVIFTGILISRALFPSDIGTNWMLLYQIHDISAYLCLGVLVAHLLLHAKYLAAVTRQLIARWRDSAVKRVAVRFAAACMAAGVVYTVAFSAYRNDMFSSTLAAVDTPSVTVPSGTEQAQSGTTQSETSSSSDSQSDSSTDSTASTSQSTKKKEDEDTSASTSSGSSDTQSTAISLNEYLSKLYCTACHNHCPLSSPRCGRSAQQIAAATTQYNTEYSVG